MRIVAARILVSVAIAVETVLLLGYGAMAQARTAITLVDLLAVFGTIALATLELLALAWLEGRGAARRARAAPSAPVHAVAPPSVQAAVAAAVPEPRAIERHERPTVIDDPPAPASERVLIAQAAAAAVPSPAGEPAPRQPDLAPSPVDAAPAPAPVLEWVMAAPLDTTVTAEDAMPPVILDDVVPHVTVDDAVSLVTAAEPAAVAPVEAAPEPLDPLAHLVRALGDPQPGEQPRGAVSLTSLLQALAPPSPAK